MEGITSVWFDTSYDGHDFSIGISKGPHNFTILMTLDENGAFKKKGDKLYLVVTENSSSDPDDEEISLIKDMEQFIDNNWDYFEQIVISGLNSIWP